MVGHRYPLHEIEKILGWPLSQDLADIFGVTPGTVEAWKSRGLTHEVADRLASQLNHHGVEVWGQVFIDYPQYPPGTNVKPERVKPTAGLGCQAHMNEQALAAKKARAA